MKRAPPDPAIARTVGVLKRLGIVREITGRKRERVFAYHAYLTILCGN